MSELIPSLNGLRGFSILCVLIGHIQIMNLGLPNGPGGQVGVNIFFVISGFLITLLLIREETSSIKGISLKNFFIRRSLRIFPAFYFLLLIYFLLQLLEVFNISPSSWFSSITYTKYIFVQGRRDWETAHLWSLSVEEHFYFIWPIVFKYLKRFRNLFAIFLVISVPLVRLVSDISVMHIFTRSDSLIWGCLFALHYPNIVRFIKSKADAFLFIPFITLVFCLLSKKLLLINDITSKIHVVESVFGSFGIVTNLCIGFIIIISITSKNNMYFTFLNSNTMNYLGKISYSIYLWQQLFFSKNLIPLSNFPINLICILIVSMASFYIIEKPFLKLKDKLLKA